MAQYYDPKSKTWYCKFRYNDWQGKAHTTTRRGFKTKREAKAAELASRDEAESKPTMTIAELSVIYLSHQKQRRKNGTYRLLEGSMRIHVIPVLGNVQVNKITPNTIRQWQNSLTGLAASTTKRVNVAFSSMLNFAVKYYGLPQNPFIVAGQTGKTAKRLAFWEITEYKQAEAFMRPDIRLIARLLFYSGMRIGELTALTPADINYEKNTISITKTKDTTTGEINTPKTSSSVRVITMPPKIIEELRQALTPLNGDLPERIFNISSVSIRFQINKAAKEAKVPVIGLHGLRHSHASYLIKQGISLPALSRRLGHASPEITLSTYSHFYKEDDSEIANLLNNVL